MVEVVNRCYSASHSSSNVTGPVKELQSANIRSDALEMDNEGLRDTLCT